MAAGGNQKHGIAEMPMWQERHGLRMLKVEVYLTTLSSSSPFKAECDPAWPKTMEITPMQSYLFTSYHVIML